MPTNNAINTGNPVEVSNGGTTDSSFTAYSVLCGGSTSTGALQNVSGLGSSGNVLFSNGNAALPTWNTAPGAGSTVSQIATVTLTSAQIKSLNATPITLVAAQGLGTAIMVLKYWAEFIYGGTNVFTAAAAQTIDLKYNNSAGFKISTMVTNFNLVSTSASIASFNSEFSVILRPTSAQATNVPIVAANPIATEISGNAANNNTVKINISYIVTSI